jgi:hypothetical protein
MLLALILNPVYFFYYQGPITVMSYPSFDDSEVSYVVQVF